MGHFSLGRQTRERYNELTISSMWSPMGESVHSMCLNELLYMCDALDGNAPCGFVTEIIKAEDVGVAERVGGTDAEK